MSLLGHQRRFRASALCPFFTQSATPDVAIATAEKCQQQPSGAIAPWRWREHLWDYICDADSPKNFEVGASVMRALIVGLCLWASSSFAAKHHNMLESLPGSEASAWPGFLRRTPTID
jgi:hypothetical protein